MREVSLRVINSRFSLSNLLIGRQTSRDKHQRLTETMMMKRMKRWSSWFSSCWLTPRSEGTTGRSKCCSASTKSTLMMKIHVVRKTLYPPRKTRPSTCKGYKCCLVVRRVIRINKRSSLTKSKLQLIKKRNWVLWEKRMGNNRRKKSLKSLYWRL